MFGKKRKEPRRRRPRRMPEDTRPPPRRAAPSSLDRLDTVDAVHVHEEAGGVLLMIQDVGGWHEGLQDKIRKKVQMYTWFVANDQLTELAPEWPAQFTEIVLMCSEVPPGSWRPFFEEVGAELADAHGTGLSVMDASQPRISTWFREQPPRPDHPVAALRGARAFRAWAAQALRNAGIDAIHGEDALVILERDTARRFHLDNVWAHVAGTDVETLQETLRSWAAASANLQDDDVEETLIVVVRTDEHLPPEASLATLPWADPLRIAFVADSPTRMRYLTTADLEAMELTPEEAFRTGLQNLVDQVGQDVRVHEADGWFGVTCGGFFESSLPLLGTGMWPQFEDQVEGDLIVCMPARDLVFVTGTEARGAQAEIRRRIEDVVLQGMSYPLWPGWIRWKEGEWQVWDPEGG